MQQGFFERAYDVVTLPSDTECDPVEGVKAYYEKDERGDEFVEPFACHNEGVVDGDAMVFFNFRPDRAREMTRAVFSPKISESVARMAPQTS